MKRIFIILVVLLCFATFSSAESWRVFDNAGLFTAEETEEIEQAIFSFQRKTNFDFAILTTDDYIGNANWQSIADSFYLAENFGFGIHASGMLYYIDMNQRIPYISTCGEMVDAFDSNAITSAHEKCFDYLVAGKYKEAAIQMIETATENVEAYKKGAE